jgi:hypothetical protein
MHGPSNTLKFRGPACGAHPRTLRFHVPCLPCVNAPPFHMRCGFASRVFGKCAPRQGGGGGGGGLAVGEHARGAARFGALEVALSAEPARLDLNEFPIS